MGEKGTEAMEERFVVHSKETFVYPPRFKTEAQVQGAQKKSHLAEQYSAVFKYMGSEEDKPRSEPVGGDHQRM